MIRLTRIYTRGGDSGQTSLGDGSRVEKFSLRITVLGTLDEANAAIGLAISHIGRGRRAHRQASTALELIQNELFDLGAEICQPNTQSPMAYRIADDQIERLEREIDAMNEQLAPLDSFVLPGGTLASAHLHPARTVVRRVERLMVELSHAEAVSSTALRYVNRLSDHLFVMARLLNDQGQREVLWVPKAIRLLKNLLARRQPPATDSPG